MRLHPWRRSMSVIAASVNALRNTIERSLNRRNIGCAKFEAVET
jgi:IS30 family transposase